MLKKYARIGIASDSVTDQNQIGHYIIANELLKILETVEL